MTFESFLSIEHFIAFFNSVILCSVASSCNFYGKIDLTLWQLTFLKVFRVIDAKYLHPWIKDFSYALDEKIKQKLVKLISNKHWHSKVRSLLPPANLLLTGSCMLFEQFDPGTFDQMYNKCQNQLNL